MLKVSNEKNLGRRERKRFHTLTHLSTVAFKLFQREGYERVTMEKIALVADVARATLYNHFPNKEALLAHWIHAQLESDLDKLLRVRKREQPFVVRISRLLSASAKWCEEHREYLPHYVRFRFLNMESALDQREPRITMDRAFEILIVDGQRAGELRPDHPASQMATLVLHLYLGALLRWLTLPDLLLRDEFAAVVRIFIEGAGSTPKVISFERGRAKHRHTA